MIKPNQAEGETMTRTYTDLLAYQLRGYDIKLRAWSRGWYTLSAHKGSTLVYKKSYTSAVAAMANLTANLTK